MNGIEGTPRTAGAEPLEDEALVEDASVEGAEAAPANAPTETRAEASARVASEDAALVDQAMVLIAAAAGDPMMSVELARTWIRDLSLDIREDRALNAQERVEVEALLGRLQAEAERAAREAAASSGELGTIFGWIGTGLAVLVSAATSWCTGGASLALGIAAVACMLAAQTVSTLAAEGIITDAGQAMGWSIALSAIGAALSFGASAAGSGVQAGTTVATEAAKAALEVTRQALEAVRTALDVATAVVGVASSVNAMVGTVFTFDADRREVDGERHALRADVARAEVDENSDAIAMIARGARRAADTAAKIREARNDGMRAAIMPA